ncbi:MAG TPA: hypothetical protein VFJ49_09945 [Methyloceanibacter sp.]|nr:hypothetical protein [Methyloceanibacter sp.]
MRPTTFVMTVFIGCGIPSIAACQSAVAAPLPQVAGGALGASVIETVGYWKRYCRYNDCSGTPNVVVVPTPAPAAVPAVPTAPIVVPQSPPVIAVVPVRPVSCGEFHYWSGSACVDARYNNPYIGPR